MTIFGNFYIKSNRDIKRHKRHTTTVWLTIFFDFVSHFYKFVSSNYEFMAKITLSLSSRVRGDGASEVYVRFVYSKTGIVRGKTGIFVTASRWSDKEGRLVIPRFASPERQQLLNQQTALDELQAFIYRRYSEDTLKGAAIDKQWMRKIIEFFHNPAKALCADMPFVNAVEAFIKSKGDISCERIRSIERAMSLANSCFASHGVTSPKMNDIDASFINRYNAYILDDGQRRRSRNCASLYMSIMRSFIRWAVKQHFITDTFDESFESTTKGSYGTPYYLTIEERNRIYEAVMPDGIHEQIRDTFIFQCFTGCRVSDLFALSKSSVSDGALHYIAHKTSAERPATITVPLSKVASEIVKKYSNSESESLFPRIHLQTYHKYIRKVLRIAGITRQVTIYDSMSGRSRNVAICDVASSHLARRTFVGNLYRQVRDLNLVCSLSGHVPGSKAVTRYYNIDDDVKREMIAKIE